MRSTFLRHLAVLPVLGGTASAQMSLQWLRFDVFAQLDNEGVVLVTETLVAQVTGGVEVLDRQLAVSTDQEIVVRRFVRVDGAEEREVADLVQRDNELTWRIKADDAPDWTGQTLTFRLEYELRGAMAPAWDIPAGPGSFRSREDFPNLRQRWRETLAAWREPAGRYRFDHDVLFARFSSEGPRELNYTFKYDTAWKHPQPDAPLGVRVTPDSDYRVTELRDYLRPGPPPAVALWKPAVRVGSIVAFAALALGLWGTFAIGEIRRRGWFGPRLDREWFRLNITSIPAEILAFQARRGVSGFPLWLARLRRQGAIEIHETPGAKADDDPIVHLRLLASESGLAAHDRAVVRRLFPKGRDITSAELQQIYGEGGFEPEEVLDEALDEPEEAQLGGAKPPRSSWFWGALGRLMIPIFLAAAALILLEAFSSDYNDSLDAGLFLAGGFVALAALIWFVPKSNGGLALAGLALVPIAAGVPGLITLHFHHTQPLRPEGSAGLALLALGLVVVWLQILRMGDEDLLPQQKLAALGQQFVRRELRRSRPQLDDAWSLHIAALGCVPEVEKWRARAASAAPSSTLPSSDELRPFTGIDSFGQERDWTDELFVLSAEERRRYEAEDAEDSSAS